MFSKTFCNDEKKIIFTNKDINYKDCRYHYIMSYLIQ